MNEEMFILLIHLQCKNVFTPPIILYRTSIVLLHAILRMSGDMIPQEHFGEFYC